MEQNGAKREKRRKQSEQKQKKFKTCTKGTK
jgi:hypothetical protein